MSWSAIASNVTLGPCHHEFPSPSLSLSFCAFWSFHYRSSVNVHLCTGTRHSELGYNWLATAGSSTKCTEAQNIKRKKRKAKETDVESGLFLPTPDKKWWITWLWVCVYDEAYMTYFILSLSLSLFFFSLKNSYTHRQRHVSLVQSQFTVPSRTQEEEGLADGEKQLPVIQAIFFSSYTGHLLFVIRDKIKWPVHLQVCSFLLLFSSIMQFSAVCLLATGLHPSNGLQWDRRENFCLPSPVKWVCSVYSRKSEPCPSDIQLVSEYSFNSLTFQVSLLVSLTRAHFLISRDLINLNWKWGRCRFLFGTWWGWKVFSINEQHRPVEARSRGRRRSCHTQ